MATTIETDQPERARALYQETLQAGRAHGDPVLVCAAWEGLAEVDRDPSKQYALMEDSLAQVPYCLQFYPTRQLGMAAYTLGDLARAEGWFQRALEHATELGALHWQAQELYLLGRTARHRGDYDRAMALLEHSQAQRRRAGDTYYLCGSLWAMGEASWCRGDLAQASRRLEQSLGLSRQHGYSDMAADAQCVLALVACEQGHYDRAVALCAAALDDLPAEWYYEQGLAVSVLARVALCRGDAPRAINLYREALEHMQQSQLQPYIVEAVESLSWALAVGGQAVPAAQMLACAARKRDEMGMALHPVCRPYHDRAVETVRAALDQGAFAAAWAEGEGLSLDEAIALACR
jgi:ATP/maltotriose-dependent transcriptional regulator MalT